MNTELIDQQQLKLAYQATKGIKIPSIPRTLLTLQQELNQEEPDQQTIIKLIGEDISLSGKIIQNINSAAFGLKVKVTSIEHSVIILGIRNLRDMIVSTALRKALEDNLPGFMNITEYSHKVGITANLICRETGLSDPDAAFIAGLFHKAGIMLLMQKIEKYQIVYERLRYDPAAWISMDQKLFQSQHPLVSFILAYHWKLPDDVNQSIALHLADISAIENDSVRLLVATLQLASYLVLSREDGFTDSTSLAVQKIEAMKALNMDEATLASIAEKLNHEQ